MVGPAGGISIPVNCNGGAENTQERARKKPSTNQDILDRVGGSFYRSHYDGRMVVLLGDYQCIHFGNKFNHTEVILT
jgi:hypothetical protein